MGGKKYKTEPLGNQQETSIIPLKHGRTNLVCHLYPNTYHIGMSNLGFQKTFRLWSEGEDDFLTERAFIPEDLTFPNQARKREILTYETNSSPYDFPVLSVSISYELDYLNFIRFLSFNDIPLRKDERDDSHPIVVLGGAAVTINPLPVTGIADIMVIGEGETILPKIRKAIIENLDDKENNLQALRKLKGVYYEGKTGKTDRLYEERLLSPTHSTFLAEDTAFSNTFLVELGRGCGAHCRFCTAGYIYRPVRFYKETLIKDVIDLGSKFTEKIGIFASDIFSHPNLKAILEHTASKGLKTNLSSFRLDKYDGEIVRLLKENNCKSLTIAPEAGSEELRKNLNKPLTDKELYERIAAVFDEGMFSLKLYFLIGLPGERLEDVEVVVKMVEKIQKIMASNGKKYGYLGGITAGFNIVVPKPVTPYFELVPDEIKTLKSKLKVLQKIKRIPNVKLQLPSIQSTLLQSLISNGTEKDEELFVKYAHSGIEGKDDWKKVLTVKEMHKLSTENLKANEGFNRLNEIINFHVTPKYLKDEFKRGEKGNVSPDCLDLDKCSRCGLTC